MDSVTLTFRRSMLDHALASRPKIALYSQEAQLDEKTVRYTSDAEVRGDGYSAGGMVLTGGRVEATADGFALTFDDPMLNNVTITARMALVYLADDAGRAVRVIDFGKNITSTNGPFRVTFPTAEEGGIISV